MLPYTNIYSRHGFKVTRSHAVARIADRAASQHLCGSRDVIGHVILHRPFPNWWSFGTKALNQAVFKILGSKRIGVSSLTLRGHVTSPVP